MRPAAHSAYIGVVNDLSNSRSVSLENRTHRPYTPTTVPKGIQIRSKIDKAMPKMRAQDRNLSKPIPTMMPGSERAPMTMTSARPVRPMIGKASSASGSPRGAHDSGRAPKDDHEYERPDETAGAKNDVQHTQHFHVCVHAWSPVTDA